MRRVRRILAASACALAASALVGIAGPPADAEAAIKTAVVDRVLQVQGSERSERVRVECVAGDAKVNGSNPKGGAVACSRIVEIDASMGAGNDRVDFSGITSEFGEARFPGFGTGTGTAALGGRGNDRLIGSRVAFNVFYGEPGNDRAAGGDARDVLNGGTGDDNLNGADGRDSVIGDAGDDRLLGGNDGDLLSGGTGNDFLLGGPGGDVLGGGAGRDKLRGGPGRDRLVGGPGKDDLSGGPGKDEEIEKTP